MRPFQFAFVAPDESPQVQLDGLHLSIYNNLQTGPRPLAQKIIDSGQFHRAMVQHLFEHLMGREMLLDSASPASEVALLDTLSQEFQAHDNFKKMVKRLVMLEQYRRAF